MIGIRMVRSVIPLLCAAAVATPAASRFLDQRADSSSFSTSTNPFTGHAFRAVSGCTQGELVTARIRPVTVHGTDLMQAFFTMSSAAPGSHWTFGLEVRGGGSGEAADGEFTVDPDGTATITDTARAAHVRQVFRLLAQEDAATPATGSSCEIRTRVKY